MMTPNDELRLVLKSIRKIARALDIHSRVMNRESGLTLPQLIVLHSIRDLGNPSGAALAREADLSPPTILGILDKLAAKDLITRHRLETNRRVVLSQLTDKGKAILEEAPSPLGELFERRFLSLSESERLEILTGLQKVADFTKSDKLDGMIQVPDLPMHDS